MLRHSYFVMKGGELPLAAGANQMGGYTESGPSEGSKNTLRFCTAAVWSEPKLHDAAERTKGSFPKMCRVFRNLTLWVGPLGRGDLAAEHPQSKAQCHTDPDRDGQIGQNRQKQS